MLLAALDVCLGGCVGLLWVVADFVRVNVPGGSLLGLG